MAQITVVKLNDFCNTDKFEFLNFLPRPRRELIHRYKSHKDAYRSYVGALLIRYVVCKQLMCRNSDLIFDYNFYGKPFLSSHNDCFFNLSHSGSYVSCILDKKECGIDIEPISRIHIDIAKRFFHKKEYLKIQSFENKFEAASYFYFIWTMKEAYIKNLGTGLSKKLSSFFVQKDTNGKIIVTDEEKYSIKPEFYNSMLTKDNYYISSASFSEPVYKFITDIEFMEMIKTCNFFDIE